MFCVISINQWKLKYYCKKNYFRKKKYNCTCRCLSTCKARRNKIWAYQVYKMIYCKTHHITSYNITLIWKIFDSNLPSWLRVYVIMWHMAPCLKKSYRGASCTLNSFMFLMHILGIYLCLFTIVCSSKSLGQSRDSLADWQGH